jgi:DNA processing protein
VLSQCVTAALRIGFSAAYNQDIEVGYTAGVMRRAGPAFLRLRPAGSRCMTLDEAVALSLILSRIGLFDRLRAGDPTLIEAARRLTDTARDVRRRAVAADIHVIAWNDPRFPAPVLAIPDPPPALWYRGTLDALDAPAVAIVGSRAASHVALETATRLGEDLARRGITVVSGLARGVDSAAHRGALRAGRTIGVLGSGVDRIYPPEHRGLARDMATSGLVCSEYPPGTAPLPFQFPKRNRLISGLSRAVVVIEASEKSGSLITASCALEQGRDVMAVPGNVLSGRNRGAHALIRDGAKIVESADDILEDLGWGCAALQPSRATHASPLPSTESMTSGDPLLRLMREGEPYDLDGLADLSGVDGVRLLPRLLDLELAGLVHRVGGGRFMRRI